MEKAGQIAREKPIWAKFWKVYGGKRRTGEAPKARVDYLGATSMLEKTIFFPWNVGITTVSKFLIEKWQI